jgi:hypothetical protein
MVREGYHSITIDVDTRDRLKIIQRDKGLRTIPETIRNLILNETG